MSKNREESTNYYLYIDGQAVPVSEQVYRVYQHYERKEEYFSYDLKTEKFQKDTAIFLPSREDSYERLLEKDKQFAASGQPVEEQAVSSVWLEELLQHLSSDERIILHKLYFEDKSERIVSMELGISKTALHYIELDEGHAIFEISIPGEWIGKTIGQLDIRKKYNINIMALKTNDIMNLKISSDTQLLKDSTMLVLGETKHIQKCFHI